MTSRFSGTLQITDLNDFITPSQECIKPIEIQSNKSKTGSKIKIQLDNAYLTSNEIEQPEKLQKVEITLADCLACSGCITSAESVLITQQSREELLRVFEKNKIQEKAESSNAKYIVISLSVQPILSLAQRYELAPEQAFHKLAAFFYQLGASLVLDMTVADDLSLLEGAKEFIERYKANKNGVKNQLPMLSSSCPGWVCYAEKTHGNFILPYISITKSPQQIMGSLVKHNLVKLLDISSEQIYHVTVMPCYDKKLEASREDFFNQQTKTKDVDCVITPVELEQMLSEKGLTLNEIDENAIQQSCSYYTEDIEKRLRSHIGSGSGGYADFILRWAAKNLFDEENITVDFKNLKNPDFREAELKKDNQVLLKFAIINGFRNIQNIVQKLKRGKCTYDYVEIMACPSGCLNGGAQIRPEGKSQFRELLSTLENSYHKLPLSKPEENIVVQHLYKIWQEHEPQEIKSYLTTQYHEIQKMNTALAIKW